MAITGVAVQAGMSLVDGKYSPLEGVATAVAMNKVGRTVTDAAWNKVERKVKGRDQAAFQKYQDNWNKDKGVKTFYEDNYGDSAKFYQKAASEGLLTRGVKDLNEQKQCLKYVKAMKDHKLAEWEDNEKEVIKQNLDRNQYASDRAYEKAVEDKLKQRKTQQAEQIRAQLGREGRNLSEKELLDRGIMTEDFMKEMTKEAATLLKFRKDAAANNALTDPDKMNAYVEKRVRMARTKAENRNVSDDQLRARVVNAYRKLDVFDAANE